MQKPRYHLEANGEFVIENYNHSEPFSNFFPGIAGKYGIPMWTFYVNRAQCISSFGVKDKDHAILEFWPANKAWSTVSSLGFRTFIKLAAGKKNLFYEPFHNGISNLEYKLSNRMRIAPSSLIIEEENATLGLNIKVEYFNIPNDTYAGLARVVTLKNTGRSTKKLKIVDGLPQIVPFGTNNFCLKEMSRTIEAWMQVENLEAGVPFYRLIVDPADRPEVVHIKEGNFYFGFHYEKNQTKIIPPIVDPQYIFGPATDYSCPFNFIKTNISAPKKQLVRSKTPSALLLLGIILKPQEEKTFYCVSGNTRGIDILNSTAKKITARGYLERKYEENKTIIAELTKGIATKSSSKEFDLYSKQTYLDNILRGGYPTIFKTNESSSIFYLYSRKHGDPERDYNKFQLQPTYFSQGNGNYRDVNQNRRCDIWFNPEVKEDNLITFFNLIQTDGFNPLVIHGASFNLANTKDFEAAAIKLITAGPIEPLFKFLSKPFSPGEVIFFLEDNKIKLNCSYDEFLNTLLSYSSKNQVAEHGEGFWTDHWAYNLDLLENYLKVYPENLEKILLEKKIFTFFDNAETVRPRAEKYALHNGLPKQLHSICSDHAKKDLIRKRTSNPHISRANYGQGEIYQTALINKILCLVANKLASLDPCGSGIEMEAEKPNWLDSINGLPALFGSSLFETMELKRLIIFIINSLNQVSAKEIGVTEEIHAFLRGLNSIIEEYFLSSSPEKDYQCWDKSYSLKEDYRHKTKLGLSGKEIQVSPLEIIEILNNALKKIDIGINKAKDPKKELYCGYFINQVTDYEPIREHYIKAKKFKQIKLPLFLEAQMHALRVAKNLSQAKNIHAATKASPLYDVALKMLRLNASLQSMPEEIGRSRIFPPGWLENESIWLHMEYKYILELLKAGLYEDFYAEFKNILIPFQKPEIYGRSILENSSFIVSSAFPDKNMHGRGFVARLSGSTAEFLQIWLIMNIGAKGFFLNENRELNLAFEPALAGWLFDKYGDYSFNFLSEIKVTYHNPKKKDTFGRNKAQIKKVILNAAANPIEITSNVIPSPYAEQIRQRQIKQIDIYLE
ncbi:MAG: cellobiose phosphorylase [Candidatus Omnitrophota bacterium]